MNEFERKIESLGFDQFILSEFNYYNQLIRLDRNIPAVKVFHSEISKALFKCVEIVTNAEVRLTLESVGVDKIHTLLSPSEIEKVSVSLNKWANDQIHVHLDEFVKSFLPEDSPRYYSTLSVIRFYVPNQLFEQNKEQFNQCKYFDLKIHNPHLDSWFSFPKETINVWVSIGETADENGVIFYPDAKPLGYVPKDPDMPPFDWDLGKAFRVGCRAGEVLLFGGDFTHGTVVNSINATRVAATFRLFLDRPDKKTPHFFLYRKGGETQHNSFLCWWEGRKLTFREWQYKAWRPLGDVAKKVKWALRGTIRKRFLSQRNEDTAPCLDIDASKDIKSSIEPIDDQLCRVRLNDDWLYFERRCPHKGADLAHGELQGGRIRCAWHNVSFSLGDGKADCPGVAALQLKKKLRV